MQKPIGAKFVKKSTKKSALANFIEETKPAKPETHKSKITNVLIGQKETQNNETKKDITVIPLPKQSFGKSILEQMKRRKTLEKASGNFSDKYKDLPPPTDSQAYEDIPVENFGAAMLRGMGWKEPQTKEVKDSKE
ncbi:hypothetical protein EIN_185610 [Entamoeba invadens IP1]|uniref:hypothetical protein n=1 Tax=Entamoeba invadens IP1 TaxID=370355 RepID=UPI0002C3EE92|nr:hypothetical protein EIN_185610 [Entamoeba invadens IP1]ELP94164.1 hypothetical protein EIN_185610 [Entamoeba invadens IP1]|eukprot:XP_004260935.1 hypothetical protein EIN_185610 [Entamoeba invadens IP1]